MWEMIVVLITIVGCVHTWVWLNKNKENTVFADIYTNKNVLLAGCVCTAVVVAIAAFCGWYTYASVAVVLSAIDFLVKRAIFAR